jgi:hypothetical protein
LLEIQLPLIRYANVIYGKYSDLKATLKITEGICAISRKLFEENSDIAVLPCNHFFLEKHLNKWFLIKKECPICKAIF